jgi:hypothetical protein
MDIAEQTATYQLVMGITKWGSLVIGASLLMLVLWFCTDGGFFGAAVTAAVMIVLGVVFLREKKTAAH